MTERRRHERTPLSVPVEYRVGSFGELIRDTSVDMSEGGMFIRTDAPRSIGDEIRFRIVTELEGGVIEGIATVVRVVDGASGAAGLGLEFTEVVEPSRSMLNRLLELTRRSHEPEA